MTWCLIQHKYVLTNLFYFTINFFFLISYHNTVMPNCQISGGLLIVLNFLKDFFKYLHILLPKLPIELSASYVIICLHTAHSTLVLNWNTKIKKSPYCKGSYRLHLGHLDQLFHCKGQQSGLWANQARTKSVWGLLVRS